MDAAQVKDLLKFQIRRNILNLSKNFLTSLEEIAAKSYNNVDYKKYRKNILDGANDRIRELEDFIDKAI